MSAPAATPITPVYKDACPRCDGTGYAEVQSASGASHSASCWRCGGLGFIEYILKENKQ